MSTRPHRALIYTAALAATTVLAGCTTTVSGSGSLAGSPAALPDTSTPTSSATPLAIPTEIPAPDKSKVTALPSTGGFLDPTLACKMLNSSDLQAIFGEPVTTKQDQFGCNFTTAHNEVQFRVLQTLTLAEKKDGDPDEKDITFVGKPAFLVKTRLISIARTNDPSRPGLIVANNTNKDASKGFSQMIALMQQIAPPYFVQS